MGEMITLVSFHREDPEDHKFIWTKRVAVQTLEKEGDEEEEEKEGAAMMCQ